MCSSAASTFCDDAVLGAGRSGMAFSFFTRDELPYLLDLHLLLSRTVTPAPAVPLVQAAQAANNLSASTSVYGMIPQVRSSQVFAGYEVRSIKSSPSCYQRVVVASQGRVEVCQGQFAAEGPIPRRESMY